MPGSSCSSAEKELQGQESCSGRAFRSLLVEALSRVLGDHWVGELPPLLTSSKGRVEWLFSARLLQSPDKESRISYFSPGPLEAQKLGCWTG